MSHVNADLARLGSIRSGCLEVRLAQTLAEIEAAQRLRYEIFYREMAAQPTAEMALAGREFDVSRLADYPGEILELGRACVAPAYRGRGINLLFRGIAGYASRYNIGLMFGCASLPGTDPEALALPLSYLYYYYLAPPALRAVAVPERYIDMRLMPSQEIDTTVAMFGVPPLLKAYLRLGGFIGDGAVIDRQFQTTDVCVIVKTDLITEKYARHYQPMAREVPAETIGQPTLGGLDE